MKSFGNVRLVFLISIFYLNSFGQKSVCAKADMILRIFNEYHVAPPQINGEFTGAVIKKYIQSLDPEYLYFTDSETKQLFSSGLVLADINSEKDCELIGKISSVYRYSLLRADSLVKLISSQKIDFNENDSVTFLLNDTGFYCKSSSELLHRWKKWIKYKTLSEIFNEDRDSMIFAKELGKAMEDEKSLSTEIISNLLKDLKEKKAGAEIESNLYALFLNAISTSFDPHSAYFSLTEKNNFDSMLSSEVLSFGFELEENDQEQLLITRILPGGSAWKTNELNVGDQLISVKEEGKKKINFEDGSLMEKLSVIITSPETKKATFTIKKADGQVKTISLFKTIIKSETNIVNGYVLKGQKKLGYIALPDFYTETGSGNALGCANDVAKEITKLENDSISGLILDLRYNGGGSVQEAVGLAGIFIQEGPLFLHKGKNEHAFSIKDINRGTAYDGPIVIMINGYSASASELLTVSLKSYNRAIIVGSPSFGKATGQVIIPADTSLTVIKKTSNKAEDMDYLKITMEKYYRLDGTTYQGKGILPDISMPDLSFNSNFREANYPFALKPDSVSKKVIFTPLPELPLKDLKLKSESRVNASEKFKYLIYLNDSLENSMKKATKMALKPTDYRLMAMRNSRLNKRVKNLFSQPSIKFSVALNSNDKLIQDTFSSESASTYEPVKAILEDIYIEEAINILTDLINNK